MSGRNGVPQNLYLVEYKFLIGINADRNQLIASYTIEHQQSILTSPVEQSFQKVNFDHTVQLNLNLTEHTCSTCSTQHIFNFTHRNACAHKIGDIKPFIQSSCVRTRHMHHSLQTYTCMLGIHTPNLDYVHANCKPKTAE